MVDPSWQISVKETSHHGKSIAKPAKLYSVSFRACLHGGGGSQVGEVTLSWLPHLPGVPHLHLNRPLVSVSSPCCSEIFAPLFYYVRMQHFILFDTDQIWNNAFKVHNYIETISVYQA